MRIAFVAGFGPITTDTSASLAFWRDDLGLPMEEIAPDYWGTDEVPTPQAWLEVDVLSGDAVGDAAAELEVAGHRLLKQPVTEPWGQTVARLLSPEGLLVGITFTPWMHRGERHSDD